MSQSILPANYETFLSDLKNRVRVAQVKAALAVNSELVSLYWNIGRAILEQQERNGWGAKVIERLSADLKREFPGQRGFSARNLKYMRRFAEVWPDEAFVQQLAAQIPWFHNCVLMDKVSNPEEREFYIRQTIENGWSRNVLVLQIESGLHKRLGAAPNNFARTLPAPQSDLAAQLLKDPYNFEFLTLADDARERELERGLTERIRDFLLELGAGFAFVGSQYHLQIAPNTPDEEDFYLDLLFYHFKLHCFVVIDLKMGAFTPEHSGKMNFYLAVVDDLLKSEQDAPSIGLILCKTKNDVKVEYALRGITTPLGVAGFQLAEALEAELQTALLATEETE